MNTPNYPEQPNNQPCSSAGVRSFRRRTQDGVVESLGRDVLVGSVRYSPHGLPEKPDIKLECIRVEGDMVIAFIYEWEQGTGVWKLSQLGEQIYTKQYWNGVLFRELQETEEIFYI